MPFWLWPLPGPSVKMMSMVFGFASRVDLEVAVDQFASDERSEAFALQDKGVFLERLSGTFWPPTSISTNRQVASNRLSSSAIALALGP